MHETVLIGIVSGGSMMETRHKQLIVLSSVFVIRVMVFYFFIYLFLADRHNNFFSRCLWD